VRAQRGPDLSVLQLRSLAFLGGQPGAPLSAVAEHVGLSLPSMSTQISGLVTRGLIERTTSAVDRRYVTLTLTEEGHAVLDAARRGAQAKLAEVLGRLQEEERAIILEALQLLRKVFAATKPGDHPG
jgi:DNA-binding MarR family transcriptional regulator